VNCGLGSNAGGQGAAYRRRTGKDRTTKEPGDAAQITAVVDFCRDRGLIVGRSGGGRRFGNTITLCPPRVSFPLMISAGAKIPH
jgi:taurine-pyruvate aminotransferase